MHLASLKLTNFKNYDQQSFDFSPRLNCLAGLNGMGKTNVLDAVHLLCLCRSHSGLNDRHLVRHGEAFTMCEHLTVDDPVTGARRDAHTLPRKSYRKSLRRALSLRHALIHIARWRREQQLRITALRRPELIEAARQDGRLSRKDEIFLDKLKAAQL